jgi:protein arginine kinase activator
MQCEYCKENTATIHLTEITDGQRCELHLCETCAQKQGLAVKAQIPLNELLATLLAAAPQAEVPADLETENLLCPDCGITFKQFVKKSLLGCPHDYTVFQKALQPVIEKSHAGHSTHRGKVPSRAAPVAKKHIELAELKKKLQAAVSREDYETAAELRNQITQLENPPPGD